MGRGSGQEKRDVGCTRSVLSGRSGLELLGDVSRAWFGPSLLPLVSVIFMSTISHTFSRLHETVKPQSHEAAVLAAVTAVAATDSRSIATCDQSVVTGKSSWRLKKNYFTRRH